jgi:hypothetical protein
MTRIQRWVVVAALAAVVVGLPVLVSVWPAPDDDMPPAQLVSRVRASESRGWSGYVETRGTIQLPSVDRFDSVGALFGEELRLRAWWRDDESWRVDRLFTTGETDLARQGDVITEWSFEQSRANLSGDPEIRLPRTTDLVPPEVGARVLRGAAPGSITRLPARWVAGRDALGLRVRPAERSSIERADLWVDTDTGVPLQVDLFVAGEREPAFHTAFRTIDDTRPALETVTVDPPAGTERTFDDVLDIADAANQYAPFVPPGSVAGLARSDSTLGAVGLYGTGLTQLVVVPLRDREAQPLREQLGRTLGNRQVPTGTVVSLGPLGVLLTGEAGEGGWLLAGTVTEATLETGARDVLTGAELVEEPS